MMRRMALALTLAAALPAFAATSDGQDPPLRGHRIQLTHGWRQADSLQLAALADAIRHGDAAQDPRRYQELQSL